METDKNRDSGFGHIQHGKKRAFLAALVANGGHRADACKAAGIDQSTPYTKPWLEDVEFQRALSRALVMGAAVLEDEARRRAIKGVRKVKFHDGRPLIDPETGEAYTELDYSDTLLIFLLKGIRPETYRENYSVRHGGMSGDDIPVSLKVEFVDPPDYDGAGDGDPDPKKT